MNQSLVAASEVPLQTRHNPALFEPVLISQRKQSQPTSLSPTHQNVVLSARSSSSKSPILSGRGASKNRRILKIATQKQVTKSRSQSKNNSRNTSQNGSEKEVKVSAAPKNSKSQMIKPYKKVTTTVLTKEKNCGLKIKPESQSLQEIQNTTDSQKIQQTVNSESIVNFQDMTDRSIANSQKSSLLVNSARKMLAKAQAQLKDQYKARAMARIGAGLENKEEPPKLSQPVQSSKKALRVRSQKPPSFGLQKEYSSSEQNQQQTSPQIEEQENEVSFDDYQMPSSRTKEKMLGTRASQELIERADMILEKCNQENEENSKDIAKDDASALQIEQNQSPNQNQPDYDFYNQSSRSRTSATAPPKSSLIPRIPNTNTTSQSTLKIEAIQSSRQTDSQSKASGTFRGLRTAQFRKGDFDLGSQQSSARARQNLNARLTAEDKDFQTNQVGQNELQAPEMLIQGEPMDPETFLTQMEAENENQTAEEAQQECSQMYETGEQSEVIKSAAQISSVPHTNSTDMIVPPHSVPSQKKGIRAHMVGSSCESAEQILSPPKTALNQGTTQQMSASQGDLLNQRLCESNKNLGEATRENIVMTYERIELDRKLEEMAQCIGDFKRDYSTSTPSSQVVSPRPENQNRLAPVGNREKHSRTRNEAQINSQTEKLSQNRSRKEIECDAGAQVATFRGNNQHLKGNVRVIEQQIYYKDELDRSEEENKNLDDSQIERKKLLEKSKNAYSNFVAEFEARSRSEIRQRRFGEEAESYKQAYQKRQANYSQPPAKHQTTIEDRMSLNSSVIPEPHKIPDLLTHEENRRDLQNRRHFNERMHQQRKTHEQNKSKAKASLKNSQHLVSCLKNNQSNSDSSEQNEMPSDVQGRQRQYEKPPKNAEKSFKINIKGAQEFNSLQQRQEEVFHSLGQLPTNSLLLPISSGERGDFRALLSPSSPESRGLMSQRAKNLPLKHPQQSRQQGRNNWQNQGRTIDSQNMPLMMMSEQSTTKMAQTHRSMGIESFCRNQHEEHQSSHHPQKAEGETRIRKIERRQYEGRVTSNGAPTATVNSNAGQQMQQDSGDKLNKLLEIQEKSENLCYKLSNARKQRQEIEDNKNELVELRAENQQQKRLIDQKELALVSLRDQNGDQRKELEKLRETCATLTEEVETSDSCQLLRKFKELQQQKDDMAQELSSKNFSLKERENEIRLIRDQFENMKEGQIDLVNMNKKLIKDNQDDRSILMGELDTYKKDLRAKTQKLTKYQDIIKSFNSQIDLFEEFQASTTTEIDRLKTQVGMLQDLYKNEKMEKEDLLKKVRPSQRPPPDSLRHRTSETERAQTTDVSHRQSTTPPHHERYDAFAPPQTQGNTIGSSTLQQEQTGQQKNFKSQESYQKKQHFDQPHNQAQMYQNEYIQDVEVENENPYYYQQSQNQGQISQRESERRHLNDDGYSGVNQAKLTQTMSKHLSFGQPFHEGISGPAQNTRPSEEDLIRFYQEQQQIKHYQGQIGIRQESGQDLHGLECHQEQNNTSNQYHSDNNRDDHHQSSHSQNEVTYSVQPNQPNEQIELMPQGPGMRIFSQQSAFQTTGEANEPNQMAVIPQSNQNCVEIRGVEYSQNEDWAQMADELPEEPTNFDSEQLYVEARKRSVTPKQNPKGFQSRQQMQDLSGDHLYPMPEVCKPQVQVQRGKGGSFSKRKLTGSSSAVFQKRRLSLKKTKSAGPSHHSQERPAQKSRNSNKHSAGPQQNSGLIPMSSNEYYVRLKEMQSRLEEARNDIARNVSQSRSQSRSRSKSPTAATTITINSTTAQLMGGYQAGRGSNVTAKTLKSSKSKTKSKNNHTPLVMPCDNTVGNIHHGSRPESILHPMPTLSSQLNTQPSRQRNHENPRRASSKKKQPFFYTSLYNGVQKAP